MNIYTLFTFSSLQKTRLLLITISHNYGVATLSTDQNKADNRILIVLWRYEGKTYMVTVRSELRFLQKVRDGKALTQSGTFRSIHSSDGNFK